MVAIEFLIKDLDWAKIDKFEFRGKHLLHDVIVKKVPVQELAKTEQFAWPDGTPVGQQTVRKNIDRALAYLAIAMLKS